MRVVESKMVLKLASYKAWSGVEAVESTTAVQELVENMMKVWPIQEDMSEMARMAAQEAVKKKVKTE